MGGPPFLGAVVVRTLPPSDFDAGWTLRVVAGFLMPLAAICGRCHHTRASRIS
jgi:hypothetical protein